MILEFFPPAALALQEEIRKHPILVSNLANLPSNAPLEERVGLILAYAGIECEGYFYEEDLMTLFDLALKQLRKLNTIVIP